ncbi:CopG family transcriptional regulator [Phormidium tenue FACHB-886]|nr:CopG family transcriptional regulator [Phormidium tenue FACHB-886]
MKRQSPYSVRIPEITVKRLEEIAKSEGRSPHAVVIAAIEQFVESNKPSAA